MKPPAKLIFSLVFGVAFFAARIAAAHGNHFHSLEELAQHIRGHLSELEQLQAQPHPDLQQIRGECCEIEVHAQQYQDFARQLQKTNQNGATARTLEKLSQSLMKSASQNDLSGVILLLRDMAKLLQPLNL